MLRRRYRRIIFFFARVIISLIAWEIIFPHVGLGSWSNRTRSKRLQRIATQYRGMSVQLGGVLIKVGQFLSSRVDVFPHEITSELSRLQDEVPAENFDQIREVAEAEFGMSLQEKYLSFDESPLAAASLGQVHLASLRVNSPVSPSEPGATSPPPQEIISLVVKVQRPNIEKVIATDLAALRTVGKWIRRYPPIRKRANVQALLDEFTRTLYEEIDYLAEGRNAETFAANFEGQAGIRVPKVIWSHTTQRVLTLENVQGIKITDYEAIKAAGVDCAGVASRLLDTYLQQIFQDGFFHADPHPGNLFVRVCPAEGNTARNSPAWQLTFVDFGMVGRIPQRTRTGIRELLIGVGTRDAARVVRSYKLLGMLLPGADEELIERAEDEIFNRFWGKNMSELTRVNVDEMKDIALEFRDLIYDLPFQVPQDIIFLFRAVGILSGICTGLDPDFNVWEHLAPFSQQLITEDVIGHPKSWTDEMSRVARKIVAFPGRIDALMDKLESGKLVVKNHDLSDAVRRLEHGIWRLTVVLILLSFGVVSVLFYLGDRIWLAGTMLVVACVIWIWMLFQKR